MSEQEVTDITKDYYDSKSADEFYNLVWGGEDIHVGLYEDGLSISDASKKTVHTMATMLSNLGPDSRVLDVGAGYGGAARQVVRNFGPHFTCLNLSEVENKRNEQKNEEQNLADKIDVVQGDFENLPFEDNSFDFIWSEDAILHSGNKPKVFEEISRVLKPGGEFIFTDPMQSDDCPDGVLEDILARIHLKQLGSVKLYRELAAKTGMKEVEIREMPEQLVNHYSSVLRDLTAKEDALLERDCEQEYIDRMKVGLNHWIEGGKKGYLNWGILKFRKS